VDPAREWRQYGGDAGASRYSPLDQINPSNVKRLKVAWVHHTEDASERPATTIECEPIVVDGSCISRQPNCRRGRSMPPRASLDGTSLLGSWTAARAGHSAEALLLAESG